MADENVEDRASDVRSDAEFTEKATGAESTYVHGGQRPLENPPRSGADDVRPDVQDDLNEMHVDSKLSAGEAPRLGADTQIGTGVLTGDLEPIGERRKSYEDSDDRDEFGRTPEQLKEIERKREEGNKAVDEQVKARQASTKALADATDATRDRTLAVQEEIATRARDGAVPGTPAFERRKAKLREILGETEEGDGRSHADRIRDVASRLHTHSASALDEIQHELMAIAAEMDDEGQKAD